MNTFQGRSPEPRDGAQSQQTSKRASIWSRRWVRVLLIGYGFFVVLCFIIEPLARTRFKVVPQSSLSSAASQREIALEQVRRHDARSAMEAWPPYKAYTILVSVLAVAAFVVSGTLFLRGVFSRLLELPFPKARIGAIGFLLVGFAAVALVLVPFVLATYACELGLL